MLHRHSSPCGQVYVHHYVSSTAFLLGSGAELRGQMTRQPVRVRVLLLHGISGVVCECTHRSVMPRLQAHACIMVCKRFVGKEGMRSCLHSFGSVHFCLVTPCKVPDMEGVAAAAGMAAGADR